MKKMMSYLIEIIIIMIFALVVFNHMIIPVTINGGSMENNLKDGDIALVNGMPLKEEDIDRFDIIVANSSELNEMIIKRVIGLPGETVKMINDVLYINDMEISETYLDADYINQSKLKYASNTFTEDFEVTLLENEYFLLGDNRLVSIDSRVLGPFSLEDMIGVGTIVIYPFDSIEWLYDAN